MCEGATQGLSGIVSEWAKSIYWLSCDEKTASLKENGQAKKGGGKTTD